MSKPVIVKIYLDDDMPASLQMAGIIRCGQVISVDDSEIETDHQELIDNKEFRSEDALKSHIATQLKVNRAIVEII